MPETLNWPVDFNWPEPFRLSAIMPVCGGEERILCTDTWYNKAPTNFFPKLKSQYFRILRHPINHFESVFAIFGTAKKLKLQNDAFHKETFFESSQKTPLKDVLRYKGIFR